VYLNPGEADAMCIEFDLTGISTTTASNSACETQSTDLALADYANKLKTDSITLAYDEASM